MGERLPCALLEACVVLGASSLRLRDLTGQDPHDELTPLILDVLTPPCAGEPHNGAAPTASSATAASSSSCASSGKEVPVRQESVELGWSSALDQADGAWELELDGLPQLCFPDGVRVLAEPVPDRFHSLALTDMRGQRAFGVVLTHYRAVTETEQEGTWTRMIDGVSGGPKEPADNGGLKEPVKNGGLKEPRVNGGFNESRDSVMAKAPGESRRPREAGGSGEHAAPLYAPICVCLISRAPYFTALQEFLSWLSHALSRRHSATTDSVSAEEEVSRFAAWLFLVPLAPPGLLHLCVEMGSLRVLLPPSDSEVHDLDLTLPFTCLRSRLLLQVLTCLLLEQKLVLLSAEWALLAPVGHSLLAFLAPLCWRHTFVPVLASTMLGFLEAPTVYLMGTHIRHKSAISEVEDLVIVDLDNGQLIPTPASVPGYPPGSTGPPGTPNGHPLTPLIAPPEEAAEEFLSRCRHLCVREEARALGAATPCSLHELRRTASARRQRLNACIQELFLTFIHHAFREVLAHLDVEQRVFSREEFLESRRPGDLPFYRKVLDTDLFDSFLKDRLAQKADSFSRLENKCRSWSEKMKQEMQRSLRRITTEERASQQPRPPSAHLGAHPAGAHPAAYPGKGVTTTAPGEEHDAGSLVLTGFTSPVVSKEPSGPDTWDDGAVFTLPPLPPEPLLPGEGQRYREGLCAALGAALGEMAPSRCGLRAALHAVRAGAWLASRQPELALSDLHSVSKMDQSVVPPDAARRILQLLPVSARTQVEERPELRWLLQEEADEPALSPHAEAGGSLGGSLFDGRVRSFALPSAPLSCDELGTCVREAGITRDPATVERLFSALTNGRGEVLPADTVRRLYAAWRATERAAQDISLPVEALARLDSSEIVYKVSPVVLTSLGRGRVAMTQSRLFLLREGATPFVEIAKFSDIEDVQEVSTLGVLRPRLHALHVVSRRQPGSPFVANLKEQHGLWCLAVREMRAGKRLAHTLKDAQFVHQALTNVLLMDAVVQCVRRKRAGAAAVLAHCTQEEARVSVESGPLVLATLDTLVHRVTPAQGKPLAVDALLYVPGELLHGGGDGEGTPPRLWCALSGGRVVVFDAATWTVEHGCLQVGTKRLNRLLCVGGTQVWAASSDKSIYILEGHAGGALGCRRHLAGHGDEVTDLIHDDERRPAGGAEHHTGVISCSADGHMITWDVQTLEAVRHVRLPDCRSLTSVQLHDGELWCCVERFVVVVSRAGEERRRFGMLNDGCYTLLRCFLLLPEEGKLLAACRNSGTILVWGLREGSKAGQPCAQVALQLVSAVTCMIHIKDQVWVGARCAMRLGPRACLFVLDAHSLRTRQQLEAHTGVVRAMCSAERRYVLSGAGHNDGQVAIWRVE